MLAWWFMQSAGLVTDSCLPYTFSNGTSEVKCRHFKKCEDGTPIKKYYAQE
jgi:hypothetical protein